MPIEEAQVAQIHALVEPILAEAGMELVELTCRPQGRQALIRLLVDRPGGVTLANCARVNQHISNALEQANIIDSSYIVEVSSPGLDRPLTTKRDFERALGEEVRMELLTDNGKTKELMGIILAVQPEAVVVKTPAGNVTVPFTQITVAKKALRW
ncbi:MAG: ribosome maturation factor RimP [Candidatus Omnitrophica bacterium]|nr:ribosome maturation factor RimP [Candidatus Omnitrophota bacterium]